MYGAARSVWEGATCIRRTTQAIVVSAFAWWPTTAKYIEPGALKAA